MRSSLHSDSKAGLGTHLSDCFESGLEMAQKQISANNSTCIPIRKKLNSGLNTMPNQGL